MLSLDISNDLNLLNSLHNRIFGMDIDGKVGFVLLYDNEPIGIARIKATPEELHIVRVGVIEEYRGKGYGDFFTRCIMNGFIDVTDRIISDYVDDYFLKFGFVQDGGVMVVESEKLVFPRKCQCGNH